MKKKGIAMLALSLVMAFGMGSSAMAAAIGDGVVESDSTTITIPKGVTFINDEAVTSYGPGITYTYTVAPATVAAGTTITDGTNTTTVHAGPAGGLTLDAASLTFGSGTTYTTSAAGVESTQNISMSVDLSQFTKPGVFRYVINDTTATSALYAAGITRDDNYDTDRYIDVFIKRGQNGLEVAGYALKDEQDSNAKDPGFVSESPAEDGTTVDTDRYETYNLVLTKQVAGAMGDTEHSFPFAATVANDGKSFSAGKTGAISDTSATALSTALKHGESYYIKGLSPRATISYQETNDTPDLYTVSAAGSSSAIALTENASAKTYTMSAAAVSSYVSSNSNSSVDVLGAETNVSEVTYTNTLEEVSPTGLILRYGMFFFMIAAAGLLILANRRSQEEL